MEARYTYNVGSISFPITSTSHLTQVWFDRGLTWVYGFHHEEAHRCFKCALQEDPSCAMAYWGIAYACGPFYNKPWGWFSPQERKDALKLCHASIHRAAELSVNVSGVEKGLIWARNRSFPVTFSPNTFLTQRRG